MKPSRSPQRNSFQRDRYIRRCEAEGKEPREDYLNLFAQTDRLAQEWCDSTEHENDMEWDLRTTDWILAKVRTSDVYAQNLYAAICNNEFQRLEVFPILADQTCSYSWRYAGGIIADMRQEGDYIDWYCSGIRGDVSDEEYMSMTDQEKEAYEQMRGYVPEKTVTEEIRADLALLGWRVLDDDDE